jgi:AraC-like DNA-binding protein
MADGVISWTGRVHLTKDRGVYVGTAGATSLHAIHAVKVAVALERPFSIRDDVGPWRLATSVVIAPEHVHAMDGQGVPVALFYFLPEAADAFGVSRHLASAGGMRSLPSALERRLRTPTRRCLEQGDSLAVVHDLARDVVSELRPTGLSATVDSRIARVLEVLWQQDPTARLHDLACVSKLSADRLTHLFREQTGTSLKHYQLWVRLRLSIKGMTSRSSLTDVAHRVGFADAAHFTRTFRGMVGVTPSHLRRHATISDALSTGTASGGIE